MEQPTISRFNSQSTSKTLVGSENGISSPVFPSIDAKAGQLRIVQTPDSKQWIDLEYLSPKVLKDLRRHYDPESSGTLAKSAARVKAWARQTKRGIEIRLRRKINNEHDEVTDIHLVPDEPTPVYEPRDEKQPLISELPGAQNEVMAELPGEITELPDSSITPELGETSLPSRTSTGSIEGEPLPRYEPRRDENRRTTKENEGNEYRESPEHRVQPSHHQSPSQNSIVATPTRGLSFRDLAASGIDRGTSGEAVGDSPAGHGDVKAEVKFDNDTRTAENVSGQISRPESDRSAISLDEERKLSQQLQDIIMALQQEHLEHSGSTAADSQEQGKLRPTTGLFSHLKITNKETYETETDVEPPSPGKRKGTKPIRKKSVSVPKRKKSAAIDKSAPYSARKRENDADDEEDPEGGSLLRKQTLPKRLPASAGAEAIWASLLRMQAKILGPEHPLTYQAKSDLARSRANGHVKGSEDLATLRKSKNLATETLGIVHPWVAAFAEDLSRLERLTGCQVNSKPCMGQNDEATSMERSPLDEVRPRDPTGSDEQSNNTGSTDPKALEQPIHATRATSNDAKLAVPKIVTDFVSTEQDISPTEQSATQPPSVDGLYSSWRPPHKPRNQATVLPILIFDALMKSALNGILWLQRNYGPEQPVEPGKVRVKWTCSCGQEMHDDFVERRHGAARELEAYLNRPRTMTGPAATPTSPGSSNESRSFTNSSYGGPPSSQTSWSSYNFPTSGSLGSNGNTKPPQTSGVSSMPRVKLNIFCQKR